MLDTQHHMAGRTDVPCVSIELTIMTSFVMLVVITLLQHCCKHCNKNGLHAAWSRNNLCSSLASTDVVLLWPRGEKKR